MDKLTLTFVKNPFDPLNSREIMLIEEGLSIREMVKEYYPVIYEGYDIAVSLDGNIISDENKLDLIPKVGTSVAICAVPRGGDGKNPLAIVAMIALMVVAIVTVQPELAGYATSLGMVGATAGSLSTGGLLMVGIGTAAFMTVGGMLINSVFPASMPDLSMGDINSSATYSWIPGANALYEGGALPEIFGTHRVVPPLISHFIEIVGNKQYLNLLFAVAGHQVDSISDVRINEIDSNNFVGILIETRLGTIFQGVIPFFGDSRYDHSVSVRLQDPVTINITGCSGDGNTMTITAANHGFFNGQFVDIVDVGGIDNINNFTFQISNVTNDTFDIFWEDNGYLSMTGSYSGGGTATNGWIVRTTDGNVVEGLGVGIVFPAGLFYANDGGGLSPQTIRLFIEYRVSGAGNAWNRLQTAEYATTVIDTGARWSAGRWDTVEGMIGLQWFEIEAGSNVITDHYDGEPYPFDVWAEYGEGTHFIGEWRWIIFGNFINVVSLIYQNYVEITGGQIEPLRKMFFKDLLDANSYDVRMRLAVASPSGSRYGNDIMFESIQEITYDAFKYPGTALLAIRALATDQLSGGMPKIDCLVTRSTVPVWTGAAYVLKSASNPAWVSYHSLHRAMPIEEPPVGAWVTVSMVAGLEGSNSLLDSASQFLIRLPNLVAGHSIQVSGFTNSVNNDTFFVLSVSAGTITVDYPPYGIVDEAAGNDITIIDLGVI